MSVDESNAEDDIGGDDDRSFLGDFFLGACRLEGCVMPGPHYDSECHTAEMIEAHNADAETVLCSCAAHFCRVAVEVDGERCGMCDEACLGGKAE